MRFAAIALSVGVAGMLLASNLQGAVITPGEGLAATVLSSEDVVNTVAAPNEAARPRAMRIIDLRTGATCKLAKPEALDETFTRMPLTPDCASSPALSRIAYWRSAANGALIMADSGGQTVLEFAPGDGVLYESVYPSTALLTIVAAKS